MAVRNTKKGGTDWTNEGLKPTIDLTPTFNAFYRKVYSDLTGTSITSSSSETDILSLTIAQNDFGASFTASIMGSFRIDYNSAATRTATIRLYVNGSVVQTEAYTYLVNNGQTASPGPMLWLASGLDSTAGAIIIKVTAQHNNADGALTSDGIALIVDAMENNT